MKNKEEQRERFHTTLKPSTRKNLRIIGAYEGLKSENEVIEFLADKFIKDKEREMK